LVSYIRKHKIELVFSNGFYSYFSSSFASLFTGVKHVRFIGGDPTKNEPFHFNNWEFNILPPNRLTHRYYGSQYILNKIIEKGLLRQFSVKNMSFETISERLKKEILSLVV
jgi:hypothetical protein